MNFGPFEPLFGKQIPKTPFTPTPKPEVPSPPLASNKKVRSVPVERQEPILDVSKAVERQLGNLFSELDQSKVIMLILALAVVIMVMFFLHLNSKQKSQKQLMYKMQKQLNRLRA